MVKFEVYVSDWVLEEMKKRIQSINRGRKLTELKPEIDVEDDAAVVKEFLTTVWNENDKRAIIVKKIF